MNTRRSGTLEKEPVIIAADKDAQLTLQGLLGRPHSLEISPLKPNSYDVFVHAQHDPGCRKDAPEFLRPYLHVYRYALVLFDREGCGSSLDRQRLEQEVEEALAENGWKEDHSAAVVIEPELEVWVWADSPQVAEALGWSQQGWNSLRQWLAQQKLWLPGQTKPPNPKKAMQQALRHAGKPWSAAIFRQLASTVSLKSCTDPAFRKLRCTLQRWFGKASNQP